MTNTADRVTRVAADLMDSAATEGARQSRSAKQQLDHWARVAARYRVADGGPAAGRGRTQRRSGTA